MIFSKVYLFSCFALCSAQDIDNFHDVQNVLLSGLDLNFQGHLSPWTSEIENLSVLHEMTPVLAIIYVIIFLIIDLSCWTSVIIIQPVQGAIFQNFYLSGTVGQSLGSSPACADLFSRPLYWSIYRCDIFVVLNISQKLPQCIYRNSDWNLCLQSGQSQGNFYCQLRGNPDLRFIMGIPIPVKQHLLSKQRP